MITQHSRPSNTAEVPHFSGSSDREIPYVQWTASYEVFGRYGEDRIVAVDAPRYHGMTHAGLVNLGYRDSRDDA